MALVRVVSYSLVLVTASAALSLSCLPAAQADSPNPPWRQQCPQRIALVLDLSESMSPNLDPVKQSANDLVDALRGARNEVAVVTFGTDAAVAVSATNVGADDGRRQVKEQIDNLTLLEGDLGGTNWDAALTTVGALQPDVVVLLTDGQPTAHGQPATGGSGPLDPEHLAFAVSGADILKSSGTRIVGLGMGLLPENVGNLVAVTGPTPGEDFYQTEASGLLDKLYDIASKACGIPVIALPQPEPGTFPLIPVIGAGVVAVLATVVGGLLLSRHRSSAPVLSTPTAGARPDPTISPGPRPVSSIVQEEDDPAEGRTVTPTPKEGRRREPRRISLARIQNADPPHRRGHDIGKGGSGDGGSGT
ncbi:MAG: VWA domain-containing protein [Actinomycetota bacterium]|nr:VWA domain-containing protein [Actinomycetota bacterium]